MTSSPPSTSVAVSPDSGEHWAAEGAWPVAPGVHRIPLPLPMDGLRAVNVYAIEADDGVVLVDGGWAIPEARDLLDRCLRSIGSGFDDIRRFLVTHVHRDHFTLATVLAHELGVDIALGLPEKPALDLLHHRHELTENPFLAVLASAGAQEVAEAWAAGGPPPDEAEIWLRPTSWLDGDQEVPVGDRTLDAVHTPGHTPGHFVFADRPGGLLFAGDHVLPTITPSIGFSVPPTPNPLGDFLASLSRMLTLPDLRLLPAHGPVAPSSHARAHELLDHHEHRLSDSLAAVPHDGATTAAAVAGHLGWTRHEHPYDTLDVFNQGMAAMETKAHLDLLVARGDLVATDDPGGVRFSRPGASERASDRRPGTAPR